MAYRLRIAYLEGNIQPESSLQHQVKGGGCHAKFLPIPSLQTVSGAPAKRTPAAEEATEQETLPESAAAQGAVYLSDADRVGFFSPMATFLLEVFHLKEAFASQLRLSPQGKEFPVADFCITLVILPILGIERISHMDDKLIPLM